MTPKNKIDVTLGVWLASAWFRHLARLMMIASTFIAGYAGVTMAHVNEEIDRLKADNATVKATLVLKTADQERFQRQTDKDLTMLRASLLAMNADVGTIKVDAATIRGILQEMQRRDKAGLLPSALIPVKETEQ